MWCNVHKTDNYRNDHGTYKRGSGRFFGIIVQKVLFASAGLLGADEATTDKLVDCLGILLQVL
jgi:hypothetical protein